jgi:peptidoglycan/LPS O-acetylase OafA/YrhL
MNILKVNCGTNSDRSYSISQRLSFLDILRVFAFISVLIGHKFYGELIYLSKNESIHLTLRMMADFMLPLCYGGAGVVVFFLVSGYIISHIINRETTAEFVTRRVFRIYPLYILAVILEGILASAVKGVPLPDLSVVIPRILLLGDFFQLPYALAGVEWTLRIEVMFYVLIAVCRFFGMTDQPIVMMSIFMLVTLFLQVLGPFSVDPAHFRGYITLYMPFLFMGAFFYFFEKENSVVAITVVLYISLSYLILLPKTNNGSMNSNFAAYACLVFYLAWRHMDGITHRVLYFLSDITYAVYLFHNYLWEYIEIFVVKVGLPSVLFPVKAQILLTLLAICVCIHIFYEKPFIRLGARMSLRYAR